VKRILRGTRHDDPPHELVTRAGAAPIIGIVTTVVGWLAFAAAAIRCILSTPRP
jgi:hypothetical protein